jgi:hypothetical protein
MRNLLALVGALVIGFVGVGWYMGWYKLSVSKRPDGNIRIETDVDGKKVIQDVGDGAKHLGQLAGDQVDKAAQDAKAGQPANTPGPITTPQGGTPEKAGGWLPLFAPSKEPSLPTRKQ